MMKCMKHLSRENIFYLSSHFTSFWIPLAESFIVLLSPSTIKLTQTHAYIPHERLTGRLKYGPFASNELSYTWALYLFYNKV